MKLFLFVIIILTLSLHAQEKDSAFCHYGFVMDYTNSIADEIGFKYRPTKSIAYFFRGNLSTQKPWRYSEGQAGYQRLRNYGGILGIELTFLAINNISFCFIASGGISVSDYSVVYLKSHTKDINIGRLNDRGRQYSFITGLGTEYFFSKHLSIGFSQMISINYTKGNYISLYGDSNPSTYTKVIVGNTKFTLSFYF